MFGPARPVLCHAGVQPAVLHHGSADVHVTDHFPMHSNVLTHHKPEKIYTLLHCNKNPIYVFLFWELRGLSPYFHIHVSVSYVFIYSQDRFTYFLPQNRQINRGNI
jgi:hypothetical protein